MDHLLCAHYVKGRSEEAGSALTSKWPAQLVALTSPPRNHLTHRNHPLSRGASWLHSVWPTFVALFGLLDAQISGNYATIILFNRWQVDSFYKFLSCAPAVDGLLLLLFLQLQRNRKLFNISRKQKPLGDNFYGTMSPITNLQA